MVSVRRVKLILVILLTFMGIMGLYQLQKRRQTSFPTGGVKISWHNHGLSNLSNSISTSTPKEAVNRVKTTKGSPILQPKVSNERPGEDEEELLKNEIDDTLEWVGRMGQEKQVDDEYETDKHTEETDLRDTDIIHSPDETTPTVKDEYDLATNLRDSIEYNAVSSTVRERDSDQSEADADLRDSNAIHFVDGNPTVEDEGDSKQLHKVTDLRDSTSKNNEDTKNTLLINTDIVTTTGTRETQITDFATDFAKKYTSSTATLNARTITHQLTETPDGRTMDSQNSEATTNVKETKITVFPTEVTQYPSPTIMVNERPTTKTETTISHTIDTQNSETTTMAKETKISELPTEVTSTVTVNARPTTNQLTTETTNSRSMYTPSQPPRVNTCNLPKLDPLDSSIRYLIQDVGFDPNCKSRYPSSLYDVIDNRLVLKKDSTVDGVLLNYFTLETINRVKDSDTEFYTTKELSPMNFSTGEVVKSRKILESDFFRISYKIKGGNEETHYYAQVVPQQDVIKKSEKLRQSIPSSKKSLPLNVLMLTIDSTSRANFLRKMPHTLNWLRTQVRSYFMSGYSIVGDATTPALTALLTGNHEYDLPEGRRGFDGSEPIDKWPWISKLYESRGYVTLYGEDDPTMSTFNLRLHGFVKPPYQHFMRPFWLAIESEGLRDEPGICSRDMSLVNYTMDYLLSFFEAYKETPKFAMAFVSYLTHAYPNHLSYGDHDVLYLLTEIKSRGYLENTMIVILGDHGSRNDDVRSTMQGKLEERLPWLSISVPDWLESRHPELTAALANNENIISSPFDLHTTLQHILAYPDTPDTKTYRSFLTNMSRDRTCGDAGIDEHWCPCLSFKPIDVKKQVIERAALAVVDHINKRLHSSDTLRMSCHTINLTAVHNALQYQPNDKVQTFSSTNQDSDRKVNFGTRTLDNQHFLVTIETSPMAALFEATVTMTDESVIVNPNISRINRYGNQPNCIAEKYPYFKKFCVCVRRELTGFGINRPNPLFISDHMSFSQRTGVTTEETRPTA